MRDHKSDDGGINPAREIKESDVCVNGMFLNYAIRMKADPDDAALPMRTFRFSITYLAILFAALMVDHYVLIQFSL